jgi:hypothetical protein
MTMDKDRDTDRQTDRHRGRHRHEHGYGHERFIQDALAIAHSFAMESAQRRRRRRRRHGHPRLRRVLRGVGLIALFTFVVVPTMLGVGVFFAPIGWASLLAAPILLVAGWLFIVRWMLQQPQALPVAAPVVLPSSDLGKLPEQTEAWIEAERKLLPWAAQTELDHISQKLGELAPQLRGVSADTPAGGDLKRLIGDDLPKLVASYRKLPASLSQEPFYDGPSPEQKLIDGLTLIHGELGRLQSRLARADLHALAEHQRYLELKYARKDQLD